MRRIMWAVLAAAGLLVQCNWQPATAAVGQIVAWGSDNSGDTVVPAGVSNAVAVAAGLKHSLALQANGTVAAWGGNSYGQTNVPPGLSNAVLVCAGSYHSVALRADGTVLAWGDLTNVPAGLSSVVTIDAGFGHDLALRSDGTVAAWGLSSYGLTNVPTGLSNVVAVAAGFAHSLVLRADGTVAAWGSGGATNVPTGLSNVVAVAAGGWHNLVLRTDGTVVAWGSGNATNVPIGLSNVVAVAAGGNSLALLSDGTVAAWGSNSGTNVPPGLSNVVALSAGDFHSLALTGPAFPTIVQQPFSPLIKAGGTAVFRVTAIGQPTLSYQWRVDGTNLVDGGRVRGANTTALVLTGAQTNDAAGYSVVVSNASGSVTSTVAQLNLWPSLGGALNATNVTWTTGGAAPWFVQNLVTHDGAFAARSGAITNNQTNWVQATLTGPGVLTFWWKVSSESGYDFLRCCQNGVQMAAISGEAGWERRSLYLGAGAQTVQWMYTKDDLVNSGQDAAWLDEVSFVPGGTEPQIQIQPKGTNIAAGLTATFSVTTVGTPPLVSQWLLNGTPVTVGTNDTLNVINVQVANTGDYQVIVTNDYGSVTSSVATLTVTPSIPVITSQPQSQGVLRGWSMALTLGVRGSEPLSCQWLKDGTNVAGATNAALPFASFQDEDAGVYWAVATNAYGAVTSAVAPLAVTGVFAWGWNSSGQAKVPVSATNVVAVAAGDYHSVVLRADGTVVAWGANGYGQTNVPTGLSNVVAVAAGQEHCLALRADGTVVAWGGGTNNTGSSPNLGQSLVPAGLSNVVAISAGTEHNLALRANGTVVAWGDNIFGQTNVPAGLKDAVAVEGGFLHSLALRADGTMVVWGNDVFYGSTNMPKGLSNIVGISSCSTHSLALCADGTVVAWGQNLYGETNVPAGLSNVVAVAAGYSHNLALRADGTVVAWGQQYWNGSGWLPMTVPTGLSNVVAIAAGDGHSLALLGSGPPVTQALAVNPARASAGFSLQVPTRNGRVYALEYKNALTETNWQALPLVPGTGGIRTLADPAAASSNRFYRVRVW